MVLSRIVLILSGSVTSSRHGSDGRERLFSSSRSNNRNATHSTVAIAIPIASLKSLMHAPVHENMNRRMSVHGGTPRAGWWARGDLNPRPSGYWPADRECAESRTRWPLRHGPDSPPLPAHGKNTHELKRISTAVRLSRTCERLQLAPVAPLAGA